MVFRTIRTTSMDSKEEIDWLFSQPLIHPQSIPNEYPQKLIAHKDQLTHLRSAVRPCKCTQKADTWYEKESGFSLMRIGQIGQI